MVGDIYMAVQEEKTRGGDGEARGGGSLGATVEFLLGKGIGEESGLDVVYKGCRIEDRDRIVEYRGCTERDLVEVSGT